MNKPLTFSVMNFCRKCAVFFAAVVYHFDDGKAYHPNTKYEAKYSSNWHCAFWKKRYCNAQKSKYLGNIFPKLIRRDSHSYFLSTFYFFSIGGQNLFSKRPYAVTIIAVMQIKVGITKAIYKIKHLIQSELKILKKQEK